MAFLIEQARQRLLAADAQGRLAHAYLICGPVGSGKESLAIALAAHLLSTEEPSSHPDYFEIRPESKSRRLVIEQIREVESRLRRKSLRGGRKVAVIHEADRMQPAAANAFLKTLEEPPAEVHLLLITSAPELMLETILSRCIDVELRPSGARILSEREHEARAMTARLLEKPAPRAVGDVFLFTRRFQALLAEAKEEILSATKAELSLEKEQLKNATDGTWLAERESQLEAAASAAVMLERSRLLAVVIGCLAERLDHDRGSDNLPLAAAIERIDTMRSDLDRNVNEALALECGFLEAFRSLT